MEVQKRLSGESVTGMIPGSVKWGKGETEYRTTRAKPSGHAHTLPLHTLQRREQGSGMREKTVQEKQS